MENETFLDRFVELNIQAKPVDSVIEGGAQKQQLINIECIGDFVEAPVLHVQFLYVTSFGIFACVCLHVCACMCM